ncbi:hypothetical protein LXL04_028618 [Taraxacum kok-saghyz]
MTKLDHNAHDHEVLWLSRFGGCFWHFWTNLPFSGWLPLALSMMQVVPFSQRLQQLKLHQLPVLPVSNNISWLPFVLAFGLHLEQPKRPIVDLNLTAYSVFSMVAAVLKLDHNAHDHEVLWLSRFGGCFWHFWTNLPFSGWLPLALSMMQVVPFSQRLQQLKLHQLPVLPVSNNISWLPFVLAFGLHLEQPKRPIVDLNLTAYSVFSMVAAVLVIKPKSGNKEMDDQGCKCDTGEERMMIHKITKLKLAI